MSSLRSTGLIGLGVLATLTAACVVHTDDSERLPASSSVPPSGGSTRPMLVFVDAGPTMTATPGDGVGVFVEYKSGGHWRIWWTCDSNRTAQGCAFVVSASVAPGGVSNVVGEGAVNVTTSQASLSASSTTWYDITGVDFDTTPGATVTLTADVGGLRDQAFLFFIQQGQVRGGFTGKLTNPLMLQGASL